MNFLAHLYLADPSPAGWVGNLLPDLVRGKLPRDLHADVAIGVQLHRKVDAFTDTHPLFARSKERLRPRHGIFSGILVDVFYDHYLARDWQQHHHLPLRAYTAEVHHAFRENPHLMPPSVRPILCKMHEQDWLGCYAHIDGIELTLKRMSKRLAQRFDRQITLERAIDDLREHYLDLEEDFRAFFPCLMRYVHRNSPQPSARQRQA